MEKYFLYTLYLSVLTYIRSNNIWKNISYTLFISLLYLHKLDLITHGKLVPIICMSLHILDLINMEKYFTEFHIFIQNLLRNKEVQSAN